MTKRVCSRGPIVLLSAICLTSIASAQTSWWRAYGGPGYEDGWSVQQTTDSGYIVTGNTSSFGAVLCDVYLIKTNASGDTLWTRTYGGTGAYGGSEVRQTADGGYVVAGYSSLGAGTTDSDNVYLIKTDTSGDTLWTRTYGGTSDDVGNSVQQTADGGFIVAGYTFSFGVGTPVYSNVYLIKTNGQGDTVWTRTYGGTSNDDGRSVQQTTDGGYIVAGYTTSFGAGNDDVYLIKTNAQGDTLWTRTYGGTSNDDGGSVQQTSDSGYIIAGYTTSFGTGNDDVYLIKTNASGDTVWTRTYGGSNKDVGYSVRQTTDGGYIIAGYTRSFGAGNGDVYLIKVNGQGDTVWTRTYGGPDDDCSLSARQTADGGYIVTGYANSFGAGNSDLYLIKTDANGNVGIEEPLTRHPASPTRLLVQPNPFISFARVPGHETELFTLSDITGRQVAICRGDRIGKGLQPGIYFLSPVGLKTGKATTATFVKAAF